MITEKWQCLRCPDDNRWSVYFKAEGNKESVAKSVAQFKSQHKFHNLTITERSVNGKPEPK